MVADSIDFFNKITFEFVSFIYRFM